VSLPVRSVLRYDLVGDAARQEDEDFLEWKAHRIEQAILGEGCSIPPDEEVYDDRRHPGDAFLHQTLVQLEK